MSVHQLEKDGQRLSRTLPRHSSKNTLQESARRSIYRSISKEAHFRRPSGPNCALFRMGKPEQQQKSPKRSESPVLTARSAPPSARSSSRLSFPPTVSSSRMQQANARESSAHSKPSRPATASNRNHPVLHPMPDKPHSTRQGVRRRVWSKERKTRQHVRRRVWSATRD